MRGPDSARIRRLCLGWAWVAAWLVWIPGAVGRAQADLPPTVLQQLQRKVVKLHGSGGLRGLESYQTGLLISADGQVLTVWSHVLDARVIQTTLHDGRKYPAKIVNYDPQSDLAILKIDEVGLSHFELSQHRSPQPGQQVIAAANLFGVATGDEPVSILRGVVQTIAPLHARRGTIPIPIQDEVLILDTITSNPGAAGGAVVDRQGNLLAMIGKEAECQRTNTWLNYGWLTPHLEREVRNLLDGRTRPARPQVNPNEPLTLELLGLDLVPDIVGRTPPFVDRLHPGGAAEEAGLRPDDLLVQVNGVVVSSIQELRQRLQTIDRDSPLEVIVERRGEFQTFQLRARSP